jgi:hypothetical protein
MKVWLYIGILCCLFWGCKGTKWVTVEDMNTNPESMNGKMFTLHGKALNAKAGAMVEDFYIEGMQSWPDSVYNKTVEVTGKVKIVEHKEEELRAPDGSYSQGMVGNQYILTKPKWRVIGD